ncbi:hypothetical protein ACVNF4_02225 [Streptomyces sp. S6]
MLIKALWKSAHQHHAERGIMPTDPYAVLRALLRAEARRTAPAIQEKQAENEKRSQPQAEQSR